MVEKIVVAVDGGPASAAAVRWVGARAAGQAADVDVTTVIAPDEKFDDPGVRDDRYTSLHDARTTLARLAPSAAVMERTRLGEPVDQLLAASEDADLLVVGTNRTSGIASVLHRTLPLALAGRTSCPLVIVPAAWSAVSGPIVVGWEDDGSSDEALDAAAAEAAVTGVPLMLAHSWLQPPSNPLDPAGSSALLHLVEGTQRELLEGTVHRLREEHPGMVIQSTLTSESPEAALSRLGREASLLVVGSHGRGAIADLLIGSIGDDLIRAMTCPVMIVPPRTQEPIRVYPELVDEEL